MNGYINNIAQLAFVRRFTISDGKEKGLDVIEMDNGVVNITLNASKALDIIQIRYKGSNVSLMTKNGFTTRDDDYFKRFEGGGLYTVGLDAVGHVEGHVMHGYFHNLVPSIKRVEQTEKEIIVEAEILDSALFGKNLLMKRKYVLDLASSRLTLRDELINKGTIDEDYCLLYHSNYGYPFIEEGCTISLNAKSFKPRGEWAKQNLNNAFVMGPAIPNREETCYNVVLENDFVTITNPKKRLAIKQTMDMANMPYLVMWKCEKAQDYALAIEPTTTLMNDEFKYSKIKPGEVKSFGLSYDFLELE